MPKLAQFIPAQQYRTIRTLQRGEEGQFFTDKLAEVQKVIDTMPKTGETDGLGDSAIVYLHYFSGGSDWWITERDSEEEQRQAFGYVCLGGDVWNAELGYIDLTELCHTRGIELDLHWTPKPLEAVKAKLGLGRGVPA